MKKNKPANGPVCENCGETMARDSAAAAVPVCQQSFQFCARCETERSANLALMNMTWGSAS
ncbi:hypothetical protein OFAG_02238 [Oxalobacter formigenes HOxBLS]|uniref:Uncharacterized protein n=1 Tax=Oxalobacter paraformigenes TaxID=556268 RepID=T5LUP3_9BURK|nr:hypothetical protein OFAG_02238 [Oxalobacter paraformigenes]